MMRASASGSLAFWMGGIVLAVATGGAWFAGRAYLPQEAADPVSEVSSSEAEPAQDPAKSASASDLSDPKPRLDEVRHETDGLVVIAGRVAPFADVILRLDGSEFARASADGSGAFATVAMLEPSNAARVLTLSQFDGEGGEIDADGELILAPVRSPAAEDRDVARAGSETSVAPVGAASTDPADENSDMQVALLDRSAPEDDEATGTERADPSHAKHPDPGVDPEADDQSPIGDVARPAVAEDGTADPVPQTIAAEPLATADLREVPGGATSRTGTAAGEGHAALQAAPKAETGESSAARDTTPSPATLAAADTDRLAADTPAGENAQTLPSQDAAREEAEPTRSGSGQQIAILRSNEEGVSVVRPADPRSRVTGQVALDSISYSGTGDVELQGRAQDATQQVRVYLDNRPVASLDVTASGNWRGSLPAVDTGVYTLRIDEVDAAGRVTSRVETPFQREAPEVLAAATTSGTAQVRAITVQRGDTLWAISRERYGDGILYVRVFEANRDSIRDPDLIYPGQVFALPAD